MSPNVVGDTTGMWSGSVSKIATAMSGLGMDEAAETAQSLVAALNLFSGVATMAAAATALLGARNTGELSALAAQVSAMAANPVDWPLLAAGIAAGAAGAAVVYSIAHEYTIRSDLSTESGILSTVTQVGALL